MTYLIINMDFLDFPHDIQEFIYNQLNVIEKCNFHRIAKFKYIKRQSIETQKKLGILYKLIIKKDTSPILSLTVAIKQFLCEYYKTNSSDPSIQDIAIKFPEICNNPPISLYDKIRLGIITADDLQNITPSTIIPNHLYEAIAGQNVDIFKLLYKNKIMKEYINGYKVSILYLTIRYCNEDLFMYLRTNQIFIQIFEEIYNFRKASVDFLINNHIRAFMLKHFTYTREDIDSIKQECLDNLYMDAYIDFDRL